MRVAAATTLATCSGLIMKKLEVIQVGEVLVEKAIKLLHYSMAELSAQHLLPGLHLHQRQERQ